jgi:hypothetical protein
MWEEYETTPNTAQNYAEVTNGTAKEVEGLKTEIRNLGPINVNAIDEFKVLKDRYDFLNTQKTDLEASEESLNKIIWKVFYEKPTSDLIGRVVGSGIHTGIYKITNIENNMCYIGQAANIADRWKQHIKRGVGADTPTRNKLYPAMFELGP